MELLETHVDANDATFKANRDRMQQLVVELRDREASARAGGGPKYLEDVEATSMFPPTVRLNGWRLKGANLELYELVAVGWP